jgi:hypothetical protein
MLGHFAPAGWSFGVLATHGPYHAKQLFPAKFESRTSVSPSVVTNPQHNTLKISQDGNRPRPPPCSRRAPQYVIPRRVGAAMRWRQLSFRRNMKPSREERLTSIQRSLSPPTPTSGCWCVCTSSWLVSTPTTNAHIVCANRG